MRQSSLTSFFSKKRGRGSEAKDEGHANGRDSCVEAAPKSIVFHADSAITEEADFPQTGVYGPHSRDYYAQHALEFHKFIDAQQKPTAVNMAKIFQEEGYFDSSEAMQEFWQLSYKAPTTETSSLSSSTVAAVPYAVVTDTLVNISLTSSRMECIRFLTRLLQTVMSRCPGDLVTVIYLITNKQAPAHEGVELGVGDAVLIKVVAECCGMTEARVKEEYKRTGDLAEIAQENKRKQSTLLQAKLLTARAVFSAFREIALMSGKDTMRRRIGIIKRLIRDAQGPEVNFIVRALQQKMRIGVAESSTLASLGFAAALNFLGPHVSSMSPEELQIVLNVSMGSFSRIFYEVPNMDVVITALLRHGFMVFLPGTSVAISHVAELSIRPGLPVKPQLAHPTNGVAIILNRLQGKFFTSEYKYDGERAQIHYHERSGFQLFSRSSETHTGKYPDVIAMLPDTFDATQVRSFIIDSEIVAVNPETGTLQAFQVLQHRSRKNTLLKDVIVPVCVFMFDLLYFNGERLMSRPLEERREVLCRNFKPVSGKMAFAENLDSDNVEDIHKFLEKSVADGCEGLMIKTLREDATYTPAKRSRFWLKLKKDYMDGVTDTLDLMPIAAFYGKGKRAGVYGGFLLACYDAESDEYQSICKIGTGFKDEEIEKLTQFLQPYVTKEKPGYYRTGEENVDVWLLESQVWEVKAADLSISPVHFAAIGLVDPTRGIALRFPRYVRTREDKTPTDCTNAQQVADMYRAQSLAIQEAREAEEDEL